MIGSAIAALLAALALLFVPHPLTTARSVAPTPAPGVSQPSRGRAPLSPGVSGSKPTPAPATVAAPPRDPATMVTCPAGTRWQGADFGCVATQLPGETDGRAQG